MSVDIEQILEAARTKKRDRKVDRWVRENPDEAEAFHNLVDRLETEGHDLFPHVQTFIDKVGGPPGHENTVRQYINERRRRNCS